MKKHLVFLTAIVFICASKPVEKTLTGTNIFAIDLFKTLAKDNSKNLVLSPYSISQALAMTYDGSANRTKAQMKEVLYFPDQKETIGPYYHQINSSLDVISDSVNFTIANGLWTQNDYTFLPEYLNSTAKNYNAPVELLNYKSAKGRRNAVEQINKWVTQKTYNNINDLISNSDLNRLTRMVLTNAIWFKADWQKGFEEKNTNPGTFENLNNKNIEIPFMHQTSSFEYFENKQVQAIKLPYINTRFSFMVFLPKSTDEFLKVLQELSWKTVSEIQNKMESSETDLLLPKFKLESDLQLKETLQTMGITLAFNDTADFSGMTGDTDLKIDKVIHKAMIDVSEKGTEAAAATGVTMIRKTAYVPPVKFHANRPFIYFIYDDKTEMILFIGQYINAE